MTWPTRRETLISSVMVLIFACLAAIFFFLSDQIISWVVEFILGIGGGLDRSGKGEKHLK